MRSISSKQMVGFISRPVTWKGLSYRLYRFKIWVTNIFKSKDRKKLIMDRSTGRFYSLNEVNEK
jgi:hypothetical protein